MKKRGELGKRGQITIFIIIAVLLLFSSATYFYIKNKEMIEKTTLEFVKVREATEEQAPVTFFVQQCIAKVGTEAFEELGYQGGYIELDETEFRFNDYDITESDVFIHGELTIPYWHYLKSRNRDTSFVFSSKRPELSEIEDQVSRYLENELMNCFNDFEKIKDKGYGIEILGEPEVTTKVRSRDIIFQLEYPFTTAKGGTEKDYNDFYAKLNLNFKDIYDLATEITEAEINFAFFEDFTNAVLSAVQGLDSVIPPRYISTFGSTPRFWIQNEVKDRIQELLTLNFNYIRIPGTANDARIVISGNPDDPYVAITQAMVRRMEFPILEETDKDISANLYYMNWPAYVKIGEGFLLGPTTTLPISNLLNSVGLGAIFQQYDFSFDISYPVWVELRNENALNGNGYSFYFALESNLRNGNPLSDTIEVISFGTPESDIVCNPSHRRSGEITITTKDKSTGEPLDNVLIEYSCADLYTCFIDTTQLINDSAVFKDRLPTNCGEGNGFITLSKPGYQPVSIPYTAKWDESETLGGELYPFNELKVKILKRSKQDLYNIEHWSAYQGSSSQDAYIRTLKEAKSELGPYDEVFVALERLPEEIGEHAFETFATFEANSGDEEKTIRLIPGKYHLSSQIVYMNNVTITTPEITCTFEQRLAGCEEMESQENEFESIPIGGAELNITIGDNIYDAESITFFVITPEDIPSTSGELESAMDIEELSQNPDYKRALSPLIE